MAGTEHRTLDPDALDCAEKALRQMYNVVWIHDPRKLAEVAIDAYMADIVRQLDLRPCEDCEDENDDTSNTQTTRT